MHGLGNRSKIKTCHYTAYSEPCMLRRLELSLRSVIRSRDEQVAHIAWQRLGFAGILDRAPRFVFCSSRSRATRAVEVESVPAPTSKPIDGQFWTQAHCLKACEASGQRTKKQPEPNLTSPSHMGAKAPPSSSFPDDSI